MMKHAQEEIEVNLYYILSKLDKIERKTVVHKLNEIKSKLFP